MLLCPLRFLEGGVGLQPMARLPCRAMRLHSIGFESKRLVASLHGSGRGSGGVSVNMGRGSYTLVGGENR